MENQPTDGGRENPAPLGAALRVARRARALTLQQVASAVGISASALSQIENGKTQPTMKRLYDLVEFLDVPLDEVFGGGVDVEVGSVLVSRTGDHTEIALEDGVVWKQINPPDESHTEVLVVDYPPGARTSDSTEFIRHRGRETGYVLSGTLVIELGEVIHTISRGDSITFDSSVPHRVSNPHEVAAQAVWVTFAHNAPVR
ncbi:helix-turn-helix domain-containing protein [Gordonia insulae]|uniref:helix-turn-helix domain-containing protein n=1 Tax=Gordonia insulae TaxID=2420509 RepID=UPI0013DDBCD0|nr:XRE family transcriptional regulator [Gordonia insulae]